MLVGDLALDQPWRGGAPTRSAVDHRVVVAVPPGEPPPLKEIDVESTSSLTTWRGTRRRVRQGFG